MSEIASKIDSRSVDRVCVYRATDISTTIAMTPEMLSRAFTEKLEYVIRTDKQRGDLMSVLKKIKTSPSNKDADIRIGLILTDSRSGLQYSIYSDEFGRYGYVNGARVQTNDELLEFVNHFFNRPDF
jgi:hypothetical protein